MTERILHRLVLTVLVDGVSSGDDMPPSGQNALVDYVSKGGGLILFEWVAFEISRGRYDILRQLVPITRDRAEAGTFQYQVPVSHPVVEGFADAFMLETGTNVGQADFGTVLVTSGPVNDVVVAAEFGTGKLVQFASSGNWGGFVPLEDDNMATLLRNAVNWVSELPFQVMPYDLNVPANGDQEIEWCFDLIDILTGGWSLDLLVKGDPLNPEITVPTDLPIPCGLQTNFYPWLPTWPAAQTVPDFAGLTNVLCD